MRAVKIKTRNLIALFFSLFLTLAVFSQITPNATLAVAQGAVSIINSSDWLYYKSNNDLSAYLGKKSSSLPTVRYQKGNDYLEFSTTNSASSVSLETNVKEPNTPTLFYRNVSDKNTDFTYKITNVPFRVKEEIILKAKNEKIKTQNLTYTFDAQTSAKPVKQPDGSIAFFDKEENYLFQLDKPFMVDAKGNRSETVTIDIIPKDLQGRQTNKRSNFEFRNSNFESISNDSILKQFSGIFSFFKIKNSKIKSLFQNSKFKIQNSSVQYQIILKADSEWLNDSSRVYPIIIDPTITHNADANFTGQMNRIADADSTSSTQLESSYGEATKDPYAVLLLHFNEANGTTAGIKDYASTTRVITANGNASTTNYVTQLGMGNSAAFDGTGDYLSMPDDASLDFAAADNFSVDFWIKHNTIDTNPDYAITKADTTTGGYKIYMDASGDMCFDIDDDATWTPDDTACTSGVDYDENVWHHIAGVKTGTSKIDLFVDGVLVASDSALAASGALANTNGFYVGMDRDGSSNGWDGRIDEVRAISRALTPEEIKAAAARRPYAVYTSSVLDATASVAWNTTNWTEGGVNTGNGEQPYNTSSLVAQWDFNDTSGTTLTASSFGSCTTSCNGTLTNFAYTASQDQATTTTGWTANNKKWGVGALMMESVAAADYVSISDPASNVLDPNSADLTIETWTKTSDTSAEIFSNNNANGTACTNNGYYLGVDANGYPVFYLDTNGATAGCDASTTSQFKINDGNWHKVSVSVTRGTSAVIYVDGKSASSDTSVTSYSAITVTGTIYFGGSAGGLDAILDSTRIYSRALSAAEIISNYNAGNIEIQTRTGATSDPNDGTWEAWKPTTGETQLLSMDSDAANWRSDIMASTTIATSTDTVIKTEGTGSLKVKMGMASTTAGTVALWHFEETGTTTGTTLYDATANNNNATTTGTTIVDGIFGKARKFNGTSDVVSALALTGGTAVQSVDFWVYPLTTTEYFVDLNGSAYVWANAGTVTATGFTSPTIYVNGAVSSTITAGQWQHIAVTTGTGINASSPKIGKTTTNFLEGTIDEIRTLNRILSPDEIAESYRMGANHHLTRQVSATDMSSANKLAFNVAADRPGTYLEAMIGESDHANYELASSTLALSTTTVLYVKGDEIASSTSIKDSSFSGKAITANGNARTSGVGKIGNSLFFDGTGDYLSIADSNDWNFGSGDFTIDGWVRFTDTPRTVIAAQFGQAPNYGWSFYYNSNTLNFDYSTTGSNSVSAISVSWTPSLNTWYHISTVRNANTIYIFVNGVQIGSLSFSATVYDATVNLTIAGQFQEAFYYGLNGWLDEVRVIKGTALSADQIRQAYEYGLRSHQITIDFGATLQSSDLISNSTDYNFSITATTSGLSATTSGLYLGDKIVIKENLGGTEYAAQGTVNAINTTTGAITVPSWDTGSTFPSGNGYSPNATVFKWQREYFDLGGAATTTRNAITNLTLRPTNGGGGRTIWLDDFRYNTNYLTASSSSAITSSNNRYLQYRVIFSSWDSFVSPYLSAISAVYTSLATMFPPAIGVSGGGFLSF